MDLGLNAFEPPSVGQSDSQSIMVDNGKGLTAELTASGQGNLYFVANAVTPGPNRVPEPSALGLVVLTVALGSTMARRRWRGRAHARSRIPANGHPWMSKPAAAAAAIRRHPGAQG